MNRTFASALTVAIAAMMCQTAYAAAPLQLRSAPPVSKSIAAFPRIVGGTDGKAAARINRTLTTAEEGIGCGDQSGPNTYWNRTTFATMRGPRYLSLLAYDDYYCGGPYPDTNQAALVFDLDTGAPIDWKALFPAGFIESSGPSAGSGDSEPVTVSSAALWKIYAKAAAAEINDKDCDEVLANASSMGTGLMLWPDAAADGLDLQQTDFPHVVKACGAPITLSAQELHKLGVSAEFISALDEAHRRGWYDKPAK